MGCVAVDMKTSDHDKGFAFSTDAKADEVLGAAHVHYSRMFTS
eukprot:COSAG01_NODE_3812_length_5675_cov_2.804878_8_plen_43_part_00